MKSVERSIIEISEEDVDIENFVKEIKTKYQTNDYCCKQSRSLSRP